MSYETWIRSLDRLGFVSTPHPLSLTKFDALDYDTIERSLREARPPAKRGFSRNVAFRETERRGGICL